MEKERQPFVEYFVQCRCVAPKLLLSQTTAAQFQVAWSLYETIQSRSCDSFALVVFLDAGYCNRRTIRQISGLLKRNLRKHKLFSSSYRLNCLRVIFLPVNHEIVL